MTEIQEQTPTADSTVPTPASPVTPVIRDVVSDPAVRFRGIGTNFKAKLIGIDDVPDSRGDKMCQESILKLKAAVKATGVHKQKIVINVSLEGIKIVDVLSGEVHHVHPVHRISFISRDLTDRRAFGYIFGAGEGKHQFFGIKTAKVAEVLVLALRDLFQVVYDMKKKEMENKNVKEAPNGNESQTSENVVDSVTQKHNASTALRAQQSNGSLLDLEQQLTTIQEGINNIDSFSPWPQDGPTSPDTPGLPEGSSSDLWGIEAGAYSKLSSHIIPLLPPPPRAEKRRRGTGKAVVSANTKLNKVGSSRSFSSISTGSSSGNSQSSISDDHDIFFTCSSGSSNDTSNRAPRDPSAYSDQLFALGTAPVEPVPQPSSKLTNNQILFSYGGGNPAQQQMFSGHAGQPGMRLPPGQYGMQGQMQQGYVQQAAPGFGQAPVPGYGQAPVPGYGQAPVPGYGQAPVVGPPFGMFPAGPGPAIPPRPGAMRPTVPQIAPGGAPQNPFGDATGNTNVLAPMNRGEPEQSSATKTSKMDPFASLIPGMGTTAPTNKQDMFKNFQMAKPPQPPPRTNAPQNAGNGLASTIGAKPEASATPQFENYLLNSVGGVPFTEENFANTPQVPLAAPRQQANPNNDNDPFGINSSTGVGDSSFGEFNSNAGFSDPFDFNQTPSGNTNVQSLFG